MKNSACALGAVQRTNAQATKGRPRGYKTHKLTFDGFVAHVQAHFEKFNFPLAPCKPVSGLAEGHAITRVSSRFCFGNRSLRHGGFSSKRTMVDDHAH